MPSFVSQSLPYKFLSAALAALICSISFAEGPPTENGQITNSALKANQDVTKAQAVMSIESFMSKGSKTCDSSGNNCRSMFGSDGSVDYGSLQSKAEGLTGASAATLDSSSESSSVATQTVEFALKCSHTEPVVKSGVALKMLSCAVAENGNATVTFQVCTGPSRGNPIANEPNAVPCSTDPKSPDYKAPDGFVCLKAACDSEPQGSRDGWSAPQTAEYVKTSKDEKNGLALVLYPNPNAGVSVDFKTDADTMTALKVVDTYRQPTTGVQAVGLRLAYRYKRQVSKEMLSGEGMKLNNPSSYSSQWRTVEMLNDNKELSGYQNKYGSNASACLTQLQSGMKGDGTIYVCDQNYDVNGIRPGAKQAQISVDGQSCTSTTQCVQEVIKTNSWSQVCTSPIPLATRECTTTTNYDIYTKDAVATRTKDTCVETRDINKYDCTSESSISSVVPKDCADGTVLVDKFEPNACPGCWDNWQRYRLVCKGNNQVHIYWQSMNSQGSTNYYGMIIPPVVDKIVTVKPFENSLVYLPPYCFDGSGNIPFQAQCTGAACTYTVWVTGGCQAATTGWRAVGTAPISYTPVYSYKNGCSTYEGAR